MSTKTKVLATIGPNSRDERTLRKMAKAGMTAVRLNFSHGDFAEHQQKVNAVKQVEKQTGRPIAILQDLAGPKIRIGDFYIERVQLKKGNTFTLTTRKITGDETGASVTYKRLPQELQPGDTVMLDDGKKKLTVKHTTDTDVVCRVDIGGDTKGRRGINLPGADLSVDALTKKDKRDLEFGIENDVDFIALSFVRSPNDIQKLRRILNKRGSRAKIIAKIETQQAIDRFDEILEEVDGVMVARGDLAIEVPAERVPKLQKDMIVKCNNAGKPVITATQMLESMIESAQPTRAEISDVANAIYDGTDAVMLSEETTLGAYPVAAVEMMARIAREAERREKGRYSLDGGGDRAVTDAITTSAVHAAHDIGAPLIVAVTQSGFTARMMSRYKPLPPVMSVTADTTTWRQLQLTFGAYPTLVTELTNVEDVLSLVRAEATGRSLARKGNNVVIAGGVPFTNDASETNALFVERL